MNQIAALSEQLLHFSPDVLIVVDPQNIIRFANGTALELLGYAPDALVGRSLDVLLPDRFRARHGEHIARYHRQPSSREMGARVADLFARRADGSEFPAGIRLAPLLIGGVRHVVAAIRDMTDRAAMSDALIAARGEAERANRAKSRFLATASHDLRQPMHAIRLLNASLLKLTPDLAKVQDLLRHQEQAIDHATRLLDSLLDISRLESGAISPQIEAVPLASLFADLRREFESSAAAKALSLEFSEAPAVLASDRMLLLQMMQNLVGNALKYTDKGYVRVTQGPDADGVIVSVEDSGIGIAEDKVERIFDEYFQVDPRGGPRLGVGLGLAIVREVSRLLGYRVTVTSRIGEGTRITVHIPRQKLMADGVPAPAVQAPAAAPAPVRPPGRLILLEDNPSVRAATELFLTLEGYRTLAAASVKEALDLAPQLEPGDILIADYRLGDALSGLDVLQRLRQTIAWELPAVLLSGDLEAVIRVVKAPIPACRFLSKPVDTDALTEAITELARPGAVAAAG
ncbi:MAG: PAS domain S-box protein [Gammaproteobacteria bacterium]|nr:PAS domain S-box protein [Gammaproteobacteria bacterium]MDE2347240.1 PAS domain S-box protein [Gammaproteobacteria bacterium]